MRDNYKKHFFIYSFITLLWTIGTTLLFQGTPYNNLCHTAFCGWWAFILNFPAEIINPVGFLSSFINTNLMDITETYNNLSSYVQAVFIIWSGWLLIGTFYFLIKQSRQNLGTKKC